MTTSFPTSLDAFTNPLPDDPRTGPSLAGAQSDQNDAIEAIEAKVGVNGSAVTSSHDYMLGRTMRLLVRKTSDQATSTISPLTNDSQLLWNVAANEVWMLEWMMKITSGGDADIQFYFPSGCSVSGYIDDLSPGLTKTLIASSTSPVGEYHQYTAGTVGSLHRVPLLVVNGGTAGNVGMSFAPNVAATATMKANSMLWGLKLA